MQKVHCVLGRRDCLFIRFLTVVSQNFIGNWKYLKGQLTMGQTTFTELSWRSDLTSSFALPVAPPERGSASVSSGSIPQWSSRKNDADLSASASTKSRYMPGLDGLRAIAVMAVIAYHLNLSFAPGGLLGVGIFFVLSGYLITDLLVEGVRSEGRMQLTKFWIRRARRLLPALLFMLVVVCAYMTIWDSGQLASDKMDVVAALFYVSNWWYIFHHVSYFASFGPPTPFGHLWSLAVEEQFYLIWPFLLAFGLRYVPRRGTLVGWILAGALVSAGLMAFLYQPGMDPSRVYYGTDTRAFGLLIGSALALLLPSKRLPSLVKGRDRFVLDGVGLAALAAIILMIWKTNQFETFLYDGGLLFLSVLSALVIAALAHPKTILGKVMGCHPLSWLGKRSYGIYLWHYPVIVLTSPSVNTNGLNLTRAALQVGASIVIADLSFRFVEEPIRHGALGRVLARLRSGEWRSRPFRGNVLVSMCALVALGVSTVGMAKPAVPVVAPAAPVIAPVSSTIFTLSPTIGSVSASHASLVTKPRPPRGRTLVRHKVSHPVKPRGSHAKAVNPLAHPSGKDVTAIGDSIMLDAKPYLKELLPGINVQGKVSRQLYEAPALVAQLKAKGTLGNRIIVELGTNGPFTRGQLVSLLKSFGNVKRIVLVNTRVPRPWQNVVNQTIAQVAKTFPNTTMVNWYADSAGKNAYFYPDGVHLNPTGAQVYAKLLANAVLGMEPSQKKS